MIPRIIHYCWFGKKPKPQLALKCIKSWNKYCPGYQIIEWNEDNFDITLCPLYVRQAYDAQKWAFVSDYVRLKVVYDYGGIYFDTDVELVRAPEDLLQYTAFFGREGGAYINTGLGYGAEKGAKIIQELMADYEEIPFALGDGKYDLTTCTVRNDKIFARYGKSNCDKTETLEGNIRVLAREWLSPYSDWSGEKRMTKNTVSIHWYSASWQTEKYIEEKAASVKIQKKLRWKRYFNELLYDVRYLPNRVLLKLLGEKKYEEVKKKLKGNKR